MSLLEKVKRIQASAHSPSGAVTAKLAAAKGILVSLDRPIAAGLTERALGEEVTAALMTVLRRYQSTMRELRSAGSAVRARSQRHQTFRDAAAAIDFVTTSPRGWAKVRWTGTDTVRVAIRPGILNGAQEQIAQLNRDLNMAIAASLTTRTKQLHAVHATAFAAASRGRR